MNVARLRPLSVGNLRAFEAVARLLSFVGAGEELHLTQSAVSRQIKALEDELGSSLFSRGTRRVELTGEGAMLLRAVAPTLERLDAGVRQIRALRGRKVVSVTTFASFASLWLIPRLEAYQRSHPDVDIRVSASDAPIALADTDFDLALRYQPDTRASRHAHRLFGELMTPALVPWLAQQIAAGVEPPLAHFEDLARHTLTEEDDVRPSAQFLSWRHWFEQHGVPQLQPRRWLYFNFTAQQVQAAMAGQGIVLARMPLVADQLARGELVEPFGEAGRLRVPTAYWLLESPLAAGRPEVAEFAAWVLEQAALTRHHIGE
jgi:LysR family glycine cleavage system transcriptional activator